MGLVQISMLKVSKWEEFYGLFRRMLLNDFPAFPQEAKKYYLEGQFSSKRFKRAFLKKWQRVYLAKKNNKIIGFLEAADDEGGVSFLNWIWVKSAFRNQGIGKKLMKRWERDSRRLKFHKLSTLTINRDNVSFYQRLGFELEGLRKKDHWGKDRYLLGKIIGSYD